MNIRDAMFNLILTTRNLSGRLNDEMSTNSSGNKENQDKNTRKYGGYQITSFQVLYFRLQKTRT